MNHTLTYKQQQTAYNALRIAAEQYDKDVVTVRAAGDERTAKEFERLAKDARELGDLLER